MPASGGRPLRDPQCGKVHLVGRRTGALLAGGLVLAAPAIAWLGQCSDIDLALADWLFDAGSRSFAWRDAWLTDTFNHQILKLLLTLAALGFVGLAGFDLFKPSARRGALDRLRLRVVALAAVLVPLAISLLKQVSVSHCPWDLARYGGKEPYLRLFDALPPGVSAGHCMPAGHASSALWLVALAVYWLPAPARRARAVALMALGMGAASGWLQQMRGAHFLTHTLWSMWISCAIVLGLMLVLQRYSNAGAAPAFVQYKANLDAPSPTSHQ
jgi:membrane-associated PAP2 superfamily phosphatase